MGVLVIRVLVLGVSSRAPDFGKLPTAVPQLTNQR